MCCGCRNERNGARASARLKAKLEIESKPKLSKFDFLVSRVYLTAIKHFSLERSPRLICNAPLALVWVSDYVRLNDNEGLPGVMKIVRFQTILVMKQIALLSR
jgi:hypothetical protein